MTRSVTVAVTAARLAVAALMLAAVTRLLLDGVEAGTFVVWNFFGFFTIQNNLIGVAALVAAAAFARRTAPAWVEYLRVCAAIYLGIVVTVYWTLLAPLEDDVTHWTNLVVHGLSGVALLADWLLVGPRHPLPLGRLWVVILYPSLWVTVVLIRGATDGWFPYPFLDPANGYGSIAVVVAGIIAAGLAVGAALFRATGLRVVTTDATGASAVVPPGAEAAP